MRGLGGGGVAFDRWGVGIFVTFAQSLHLINYFVICMIYLERRLLKSRTTVALSDLASRTYAGVSRTNFKFESCDKRRTIHAPV